MEQDYTTGTTDIASEVAGAATDVSVQRDLQANDDNASKGDFENSETPGTEAVRQGNFPDPAFDITDEADAFDEKHPVDNPTQNKEE